MKHLIMAGLLIAGAATAAQPDGPAWARLIRWMSGDSDATSVPAMMMDAHMQMSARAAARPGDAARADAIVRAAAEVLRRYPTAAAAERAGYRPFHQTGRPGEEIHYTSIGYAYAEGKRIDYAHPGSLLFQRTATGVVPTGVMYSVAGNAGPEALDAAAPLSVATWHRHLHFCIAAGRNAKAEASDPRFGYDGTIHTEDACRGAGGYWLPVAFGWMTHVYPGRHEPWGGESMHASALGM